MATTEIDRLTHERDSFKNQLTLTMKASARHLALTRLATAFVWATADGEALRIARIDDVWCVDLEDQPQAVFDTLNRALAAAVEIAPPADAELAALLVWTACGKPRI